MALAASVPFQLVLPAVTGEPEGAKAALHSWVTCSPLAEGHLTGQPGTGALPALTVTVLWKPPDQELTTVELALHERVAGGAVVGGAVVGGAVVGTEVVGTEVGDEVGVDPPSEVV